MGHLFSRWGERVAHSGRENRAQRAKDASVGVVQFSFSDLQSATDSFSQAALLGVRGCCEVFRAEVRLGSSDLTTVAVKRYTHHVVGRACLKRQIQTEVLGLKNLDHPNVVKLLGVCHEKHILVYEFMGGGDVDTLIEESFEGQREFTWEQRLKVALEAARGLAYLHENNLIHGDFKPANLLLDESMVAKVLMQMGSNELGTREPRRIIGNMGYHDPSYYLSGTPHVKCDVYSFGLFLVELITGTRPLSNEIEEKCELLRANTPEGDVTAFVDPRLQGNYRDDDLKQLAVFAKNATSREKSSRP